MANNFEIEPNDLADDATDILIDATIVGGQLKSAGDQDWFKFDHEVSEEEGSTNTFEFSFTSPVGSDGTGDVADSFHIRIFIPNKTDPDYYTVSDYYTDGDQSGTFAAPVTGTYYILVESGGRWLEDENHSLQYGLQIKPSENYAEVETNNTLETANEAEFGRAYTGQIAYDDDQDFFRYYTDAAGLVSISLDIKGPKDESSSDGKTPYNVRVIEGASGLTITSFYSIDDVPNLDFWAHGTGEYYVVVTDGGEWYEEDYLLKLTATVTSADTDTEESIIQGGDGDDMLQGSVDADILDGGIGADIMYGGEGDDLYYVDNKNDRPIEGIGQGSKDLVYVDIDKFTLPADIEKLVMLETPIKATGNSEHNTMIGNELDNKLESKSGDDILDGGAGADTLEGGDGDDTYYVDNVLDKITETGAGIDTVITSIDITKLNSKIENVVLAGTAVQVKANSLANTLTGNDFANSLFGDSGDDTIYGSAGNDAISGGKGIDVLFGGDGSDAFVFDVTLSSANFDYVQDFESGTDKLWLSHEKFKKFGVGTVSQDQLLIYSSAEQLVAQDSNDFLLYDTTSGMLYYDADGMESGTPLVVACLQNIETGTFANLQAVDFLVF